MPRWKPKPLPSKEALWAIFDYDPQTGILTFKRREVKGRADVAFNNRAGGKFSGTASGRDGNKYLHVGIAKSYYQAHRIIWKMMTGEDPPEFIDHIDGDRLNNRWANLRVADNGKNLQNAKLRKDNKSGVKGVFWDAGHKKWRAVISVNKVHHRLGRFDTIAEATKAIETARTKFHGEFARRT